MDGLTQESEPSSREPMQSNDTLGLASLRGVFWCVGSAPVRPGARLCAQVWFCTVLCHVTQYTWLIPRMFLMPYVGDIHASIYLRNCWFLSNKVMN